MTHSGAQGWEYMESGLLYPELKVHAVKWRPEPETEIVNGLIRFLNYDVIEPSISHREAAGMSAALDQASIALEEGDLPIGATLILPSGMAVSERTNDHSNDSVRGHAEMRLLDLAEKVVGSDFSDCTLITTAQLCATCSQEYASANIGKVISGIERDYVKPLTGHMRKRILNFPEFMGDGKVNTEVVANYRAAGSLALLAAYGKKHGVTPHVEGESELIKIASQGQLQGDEYADVIQELYFGNHDTE